jgi:hypothetical protein
MSDINLEKFEANSFMGIDASRPIVIDFTKRRKNQNIVELVADEALCKTSTICGILYAMGAAFDINKKQLFNKKDGKLDANLKFTYEDEKYEVVVSDDRLTLKKLNEDDGKWKKQDEPGATLRKIFGPVGLSPFALRSMRGKDQIEFIQDLFGSGEDTKKKHAKLEADYDDLFAKRRDVNRDVKNLKGALDVDPLYQDYEGSVEKFKTPPNAKKEKAELDALTDGNNKYESAKNLMDGLKQTETRQKAAIKELEAKLAAEKEALQATEKRITDGKKYLDDNKAVPEKYATAQAAWINLSKKMAEFEKWTSVLEKERDLKKMESAATKATQQLADLDMEMLKLTSSYLPKIAGLKLKVRPSIDKDKEEIGLYYNDLTMAQLNESEFAKLWAQVFTEKEMNFLFFENISSLGSGAIGVINELAKEDGVMVFGSRMDRKKKSLEINFNSKIE